MDLDELTNRVLLSHPAPETAEIYDLLERVVAAMQWSAARIVLLERTVERLEDVLQAHLERQQ